jgi:uncharacterized protein (UPF0276 family)
MKDRVGLGWRPEIAPGIWRNLGRIDVVEVMADDYFEAPHRDLRALRTLASQVPVVLHGVSLGLASTAPVDVRRLEKMARVVDAVRPESWSEHLAFVRGGGVEIGHLAAPPRTSSVVDGAASNLGLATKVVGTRPLVENIATLIDPPGSDRDEGTWTRDILAASGCDLLLDLHNLHANAVNFGFDAAEFIRRLPGERIGAIHLAGGKWIGRVLDDHLHDVPDEVYDLLELAAAHATRPLAVILERDGNYPEMECLIAQLDRAREAVASGRRARELARV